MRILTQREQYEGISPLMRAASHTTYDTPTDQLITHASDGVDADRVSELAKDISANGLHLPVTMKTDGTTGWLEDGNHRLNAAQQVGMTHVPTRFVWGEPRYLAESGAPGLHPALQQHLADNPHLIQDRVERHPTWYRGTGNRFAIISSHARLIRADLLREAGVTGPSGFEVRPIDPFDVSDEADRAAGLFGDDGQDPLASLAWRHGGEVAMISTHPEYQRQGLATQLFNHVRQHLEPGLHHSPHQTEEGEAWSRQAGARGDLPEGLKFKYHRSGVDGDSWPVDPSYEAPWSSHPTVTAWHGDKHVGHISWQAPGGIAPGRVSNVSVHPDYMRRGVGTALWDYAKNRDPNIYHSETQSDAGRAWAQAEEGRTAHFDPEFEDDDPHDHTASLERVGGDADYRMQHQAPDADYGAPLHDIETMMPDYYAHPEYYSTYQPFDHQSHSVIQKARGNPNAKVKVYRALPYSTLTDLPDTPEHAHMTGRDRKGWLPLNKGDWVSTSYDYANDEGQGINEPWTILQHTVPASQLYSEGNSIHEWGYQGDNSFGLENPRAQQQRYRRNKQTKKLEPVDPEFEDDDRTASLERVAGKTHPGLIQMPIALAKQYLIHGGPKTHYPDGRPVEEDLLQGNRDYMDKMKGTLATEGWDAFENYPAFTVGSGGRHAIMGDGNHRVLAADELGMSHIPVNLTTGEDPNWARQYGKRVTPELRTFLQQSATHPAGAGRPDA